VKRLSTKRWITPLTLVIVAAATGASFLIPLVWILTGSFRPGLETFSYLEPLSFSTFVELEPIVDNYLALVDSQLGLAIFNSISAATWAVVFGLIVSSMAAFALATIPFRGSGVVFSVVIIALLIPFDAIAIPLAQLFREWGLQDTMQGLVLPGIANGMAIFMLRTFFLGIPKELVEAARVDGLNWWGIFRRIFLPLSIAPLIGAGLMLFLFQWHSYVWPLLIGTSDATLIGPIALANMKTQYSVDYGQLFAGSIVLSIVPLVLILLGQKQFIQNHTSSGIK
jgi:putative chitobiose transport system permease protein